MVLICIMSYCLIPRYSYILHLNNITRHVLDKKLTDLSMGPMMEVARECQSLVAALRCPVCLEVAMSPVRTKCGHQFCRLCVHTWVEERGTRGKVACPACQAPGVTKRSLQEQPDMARIADTVR